MHTTSTIDPNEIRRRAYLRWRGRGCPEGAPDIDWLEAERELLNEKLAESSRAPAASAAPLAGDLRVKAVKPIEPPRPTLRRPASRGSKISTPTAPAVEAAKTTPAARGTGGAAKRRARVG